MLLAAKLFNPDKRILLLGDDSNRRTAIKAGAEHHFLSNFGNTEEIRTFDKVYRHIAGANNGRPEYVPSVTNIEILPRNEGIEGWNPLSSGIILTEST